jgi:SAM-dependent methyltransferase
MPPDRPPDATVTEPARDPAAIAFARWWEPILVPGGRMLLEDIAAQLAGAADVLDVGAGTGSLTLEVVRRWPAPRVVALDASAEMLAVLEDRAAVLDAAMRERIVTVAAYADELPQADATFDAVVAAFVLQLVDDRPAVLHEMRRVLRPGGRVGHVTWRTGGDPFTPDEVVDEVFAEFGVEPDERDDPTSPDAGDYPTAAAAAADLRAAGFRGVRARESSIEHRFSPASFAEFVLGFDAADRVDELETGDRARLADRLGTRLAELEPEAFVLQMPIVTATGRRPG